MSMLTRPLQVLRACQLHGSRRFATQSKGRSSDQQQNDQQHNLHMAVASMKVVQLSLHPNTAEVLDHQPNVRCISGAVFSDADKRAQFLNSISEREVFLMSRDHVKDFVQLQLQDSGIETPRLLNGPASTKKADGLAALPKGHPLAQIQQQLSNVKTVPMKQAFSRQLEQAKNQFKSNPLPSKPEKIKLLPSEEALLLACSNGDLDKIRSLLNHQPDTHATHVNIHHLVHGGTPLHVAAFEGHLEVMKLLLDRGADVNGVAFNNSTALHWAAGAGQVEAARLLLDRGADPNHRSSTWASSVFGKGSGQTPSHWAAESGHPEILSLLHSYGAESIIAEDETGQSPLVLAQKELKSDCCNFLKKAMNEEYVAVSLSVSMQMQRNLAWNSNGRRGRSKPVAALDGHSAEQIFDIDVQPPETTESESKPKAKSRSRSSSSSSESSSSSKARRQSARS